MFVFCPKCGLISKENTPKSCPVCDCGLQPVPAEYLTASGNLFASQEKRNAFVQEVVEANPDYDAELASKRDNILTEKVQKHNEAIAEKVEKYKETRVTCKCPVCGSTSLSPISNLGKIVKVSLLGVLGAGDLGKQRYCNSCGHRF